jgi:hypothetical protein
LLGYSREAMAIVGAGAGAAVVGYLGISAGVITATGSMFGDGSAVAAGIGLGGLTLATPVIAGKIFHSVNPVYQFRRGKAANDLKTAVAKLNQQDVSSVDFYQGTSQRKAVAKEQILIDELEGAAPDQDGPIAAGAQ